MALVVATAGARTAGHNGEPPTPPWPRKPPPPPRVLDLVVAEPLRWSWLHWWEANRDLYLAALTQVRKEQEGAPAAGDELRGKAVASLIEGLEVNHEGSRIACALALGRMREASAAASLQKRLEVDPSESVRFVSILALGLIGDEASQSLLMNHQYPSAYLRTAGLVAMGMAAAPSDGAISGCRGCIERGEVPFADAACWALSRQVIDDVVPYRNVLSQSTSPWLVNEAILALGSVDDAQADAVFVAMVTEQPRAEQVPVWRLLEEVDREKRKIAGAFRVSTTRTAGYYDRWMQEHRKIFDFLPVALRAGESPPNYVGQRVMVGMESIYMSHLRGAAAMALEHAPAATAVAALHALLAERDDDYNALAKCFAAISLGRIGSRESLGVLMGLVSDRHGRRAKRQEELESPVRGFAALALGFYAQPAVTEQGAQDRPGFEEAARLLADRLADGKEKLEVRSACAMALGLSRRTENLRPLMVVHERSGMEDYLLRGYVVLARAMLGDQNVMQPAVALLEQRPDRDQTTNIIARRAAVLALGVYGGDEAIPVLAKAWHDSYYINREVIRALSLCRAYGVSSTVVPILEQSTDPDERAYMASILGELYIAERPDPISWFLINSNFPMQHPMWRPYRTLANEFLYNYLIEEFGDTWY
jgi:HEAT repeat protein